MQIYFWPFQKKLKIHISGPSNTPLSSQALVSLGKNISIVTESVWFKCFVFIKISNYFSMLLMLRSICQSYFLDGVLVDNCGSRLFFRIYSSPVVRRWFIWTYSVSFRLSTSIIHLNQSNPRQFPNLQGISVVTFSCFRACCRPFHRRNITHLTVLFDFLAVYVHISVNGRV